MAKSSSTPKKQHGGARAGAGRKPNSQVAGWHWLQIGAMLTRDELVRIKTPNLTPAQRCRRLLYAGDTSSVQSNAVSEEDLVFAAVRVAYTHESERQAIRALDMNERRRRLLTVPPCGDAVDDRPGHWEKGN
jgi:hypothetical protein